MFIKKDLRKIGEIFDDDEDKRDVLKLSKRSSEFQGNVNILCNPNRTDKLKLLRELNLYANDINDLNGIGNLCESPLEDINLGMNKLSQLPIEIGELKSLKQIWLEDNEFEDFPLSICQCKTLEMVRLSGNSLKIIPLGISTLTQLHSIALDNNELIEFPNGILQLKLLKNLLLRQNLIEDIPDDISNMMSLEVLSMSSNKLSKLPDNIAKIYSLEKLYVNGNNIKEIPHDIAALPSLKELNLANNILNELPDSFLVQFGEYDTSTGKLSGGIRDKDVTVTIIGNTFNKKISPTKKEEYNKNRT